ncbi:DUF58 domain-containing protein [bacterium]|nr:DUF58 domain-containing protein [bacterium]
MIEHQLHPAGGGRAQTLFDVIGGLKVRPRFCRAEGPSGLHRSPQRGETVEFSEYKPYAPGVELRFLDWKLYARTDRLYVKSFCDERASRFLLVVDDSPSMRFPPEGRTKLDLARDLAAGLAFLAAQKQKDAVGLLPLSQVASGISGDFRSFGWLLSELQKESFAAPSQPSAPPSPLADALSMLDLRHPTTVIFISDLYEAPSRLMTLALGARRRGHEFWFMHVLSKEEIALPFSEFRNFVDMESSERVDLDPQAVRAHYSGALHDHLQALKPLAGMGRYGMGILGQNPADILKRFLAD